MAKEAHNPSFFRGPIYVSKSHLTKGTPLCLAQNQEIKRSFVLLYHKKQGNSAYTKKHSSLFYLDNASSSLNRDDFNTVLPLL